MSYVGAVMREKEKETTHYASSIPILGPGNIDLKLKIKYRVRCFSVFIIRSCCVCVQNSYIKPARGPYTWR
jgi:hypothetical protein